MTFTVKSLLFEDSKIRARTPLIWGLHNNPVFIPGKMILFPRLGGEGERRKQGNTASVWSHSKH